MTLKKDEALQKIEGEFEKFANLALEQLDRMESIITDGHEVPDDLIKHIKETEVELDKNDVKISDKIVNCIVLYHPVASDLRKLMAIYRIVISIERIGDHVVNIVNFIQKIKTPEVYEKLQEVLHNMTIQSVRMVKRSIMSFINEERELAVWTLKNGYVFDEINHKILKKLISAAKSEEANKKLLLSIINIKEMMSNIERIADHASNIAEASIYFLEGTDIRHHKITE